jgi:hypothetical protein
MTCHLLYLNRRTSLPYFPVIWKATSPKWTHTVLYGNVRIESHRLFSFIAVFPWRKTIDLSSSPPSLHYGIYPIQSHYAKKLLQSPTQSIYKSKPICLPGSGRGPVVQCARRSQPHPGWEQCQDAHLPCCVCLAEEVEHHDAGWPERSMSCIHSDRG